MTLILVFLPYIQLDRYILGELTNEIIYNSYTETNLSGKQQQVTPLLGSANNCLESITDWRTNLPIFKHKHAILESIANEPVTIVAGDTGSGKTSQVPLYILKGALETSTPCQILSIQPNKLAALSTSKRVSAELGTYSSIILI